MTDTTLAAIRSTKATIPGKLTEEAFAAEVEQYLESYKHMGCDVFTAIRDVQDEYEYAAILEHTPGCSNPDCTYSTCRAKWDRVRKAAPDLLEALQNKEARDYGDYE
jgi:hypothetical protein